jgi:CheY-like chemotaxis protein
VTILIIEDDANDAELLKRGLRKAGFSGAVMVCKDGSEARDYVQGQGAFSNRSDYPLPDLILLDLSLPKVSGLEVLAWMKEQPHASKIPVFVLTGSPYMTSVANAYALGAKSFFFKPLDASQLAALAGALQQPRPTL